MKSKKSKKMNIETLKTLLKKDISALDKELKSLPKSKMTMITIGYMITRKCILKEILSHIEK